MEWGGGGLIPWNGEGGVDTVEWGRVDNCGMGKG